MIPGVVEEMELVRLPLVLKGLRLEDGLWCHAVTMPSDARCLLPGSLGGARWQRNARRSTMLSRLPDHGIVIFTGSCDQRRKALTGFHGDRSGFRQRADKGTSYGTY